MLHFLKQIFAVGQAFLLMIKLCLLALNAPILAVVNQLTGGDDDDIHTPLQLIHLADFNWFLLSNFISKFK
jgi:hypothetical protein